MTTDVGDDRLQRLPNDIAVLNLDAHAENKHLLLKVFACAEFPQALWNARIFRGLPGLVAPSRFHAATYATLATLCHGYNLGVYCIWERKILTIELPNPLGIVLFVGVLGNHELLSPDPAQPNL